MAGKEQGRHTWLVKDVVVIFADGKEHSREEAAAYREAATLLPQGCSAMKVHFDEDGAVLEYLVQRPFERIRRITGYLADTRRFNRGKAAELHDRTMHSLNEGAWNK